MIHADFSVHLNGFSLKAEMGDHGLILLSGENGSGKSTFLKALSGLIPVDTGSIRINDQDLTGFAPQDRRVVYATHNSYFSHLAVGKHILWAMGKKPDLQYLGQLRDAFGISYEGKLSELSMGQRMRVTIATAFASRPRAILLDEVISNISSPEGFLDEIREMAAKVSVDVVFVAHSLGEKSADHHYSMESGRMARLF